jgi:hypothetical protein
MTEKSVFSAVARDFLFSALPRPALGAHPDSYTMGTGGFFHWDKCSHGKKLITHLHLVLKSKMVEKHYSTICLHSIALNQISARTLPYLCTKVFGFIKTCGGPPPHILIILHVDLAHYFITAQDLQ